MKRFRIDFSVREVDVPEDQAQGIRLGQEVDAVQMKDFFNRCRDAAVTLFNAAQPEPANAQVQAQATKASPPSPPKISGSGTTTEDVLRDMLRILGPKFPQY